jgi:hypothetical protein
MNFTRRGSKPPFPIRSSCSACPLCITQERTFILDGGQGNPAMTFYRKKTLKSKPPRTTARTSPCSAWPPKRAGKTHRRMNGNAREWHRILVFGKLGDFAATLILTTRELGNKSAHRTPAKLGSFCQRFVSTGSSSHVFLRSSYVSNRSESACKH